jgi:hypothetical protein
MTASAAAARLGTPWPTAKSGRSTIGAVSAATYPTFLTAGGAHVPSRTSGFG